MLSRLCKFGSTKFTPAKMKQFCITKQKKPLEAFYCRPGIKLSAVNVVSEKQFLREGVAQFPFDSDASLLPR